MPEIKKGHNSANNESEVTSCNLCKMAGNALHCTKFREIISNSIQSYRADTISILKITKRNNSAKTVGGAIVVIPPAFMPRGI